jgi:hypothetical protein
LGERRNEIREHFNALGDPEKMRRCIRKDPAQFRALLEEGWSVARAYQDASQILMEMAGALSVPMMHIQPFLDVRAHMASVMKLLSTAEDWTIDPLSPILQAVVRLRNTALEKLTGRTKPAEALIPTEKPKVEDGTPGKTPTPMRPLREPSREAIAAYRAERFLGQKQENIATQFGVSQGTISRWVRQVAKWIEAGNVLPDLEPPKRKTITMDPSKLEQGPRRR